MAPDVLVFWVCVVVGFLFFRKPKKQGRASAGVDPVDKKASDPCSAVVVPRGC